MKVSRFLHVSAVLVLFAAMIQLCGCMHAPRSTVSSSVVTDTRVFLGGDEHRHDSFTVTMQAVSRLYGLDADYETIYALSCNGFAPAVHPAEGDRAFAMMHGRGRCIDLVADYLGLRIREVEFPPPPLPDSVMDEGTKESLDYSTRLTNRNLVCARILQEELDTGAVVITDGGWLHLYCLWGVIREVRPDGTIVGTTQFGPRDNPLDHVRTCWTVTRAESSLPQKEADLKMLRRAVARIRGDRAPYLPGSEVFGLAAMDWWIAQAQKPQFQEDDAAASVWNAGRCALYAYEGANRVSSYLRRRMKSFPEPARPHLEQVALRYDHIAELLAPFALSPTGASYASIMGDVEKLKVHTQNVLEPIKEELAGAAQDLDLALAAMEGKSN